VTELVVANTVNTMPEATLNAFADHGDVNGDRVTGLAEEAQRVFDQLTEVGVDIPDVFEVLEREGVQKFTASWAELTTTVRGQLDAAT
jgi:transaldolase